MFIIVAGAGAYFFAKRSVNADRKARHEEDEKRRRLVQSIEHGAIAAQQQQPQKQQQRTANKDAGNKVPGNGSPFAPPLEPEGWQATTGGKSKYEASEAFRAKKGDRFS